MANFLIPARNDLPWYKFQISLSNIVYTLKFRFNTRKNLWSMDVCDASENVIIAGIPLTINTDLTGQYVAATPVGLLYAIDNTNRGTQPSQFSFGVTHSLIYLDPTV